MKYQATSFADGVFTVVCPHCSNALAVDEAQLGQINEQLGGRYACPQGSCGKEIEFPSTEEAQEIMAGKIPAALVNKTVLEKESFKAKLRGFLS